MDKFEFHDPRQKRIYRRLLLVGPGPASFYFDACRLMSTESHFDTTTHIVGHLLREIESALRDVLETVADKSERIDSSSPNDEKHRAEILSILRGLDIAEDEPVARAWLQLPGKNNEYGLAARAHRDNLASPRPIDPEFHSFWQEMETILDVVLERFEARYLEYIRFLDELIAKTSPTSDDVNKLRQNVPNNLVTFGYFFDKLKSPAWLEPLLKGDFFKNPPELIRNEETRSVTFPQWPQSRYLARMAAAAPDTVCEIILQVPPTQNILIHADFTQAALAMPPHLAAKIVPSAKIWIESPYQLFLPEEMGKLMAKLARGGEVESALVLARSLLDIVQDPRASREDGVAFLLPRAHFDVWHYEQIVKNNVSDLVTAAGEKSLVLFCELLDKAINFSHRQTDDGKKVKDYSSIWRPAIEDNSQNQGGPRELNDILITLIRDTADSMMRINGESVLKLVESQPFTVFKRIGLYLRNKWPDVDAVVTNSIILNPSYIRDPEYDHELFHLLKNRFGGLPDESKQEYLNLLDKEAAQIRKERLQKNETEEQTDQIARHWQYGKLYPIQAFLSGKWRLMFEVLQKELGDIAHPDVLPDMNAVWVGPTSPKGAEEIHSMDVGDLIVFLQSWKPSSKWMSPTPEGLGGVLSSVVASAPERYASRANEFQELSPTYIRHLISGFREAKKQKKIFTWEPILQLCQWAANQQSEIETGLSDFDDDSRWGPTRQAIADLMSAGFGSGDGGNPFSERETVWRIIVLLTDDPDPTVEYEAKYGGSNMSPMMLSINTVRGEAMHAVVKYAIWVRQHKEQEADTKELAAIGFDMMPEVREVLERHLEPSYDRALAIRSVYGESFPTFIWLDRKWAIENLGKIFPTDDSLSDLRDAAWDTYVVFCRPYDDILDVLRSEYRKAIEQLTVDAGQEHGLENPSKHLAEHLMSFYWRGKLEMNQEDGLLSLFYSRAPVALRAHALEFIGHVLHNKNGTPSGETRERLRSLLERRLQVIRGASLPSDLEELVPFGWWFSSQQFDDAWAIARLKEVLELTGRVELDHKVVESLASLVDRMPLETVDCLRLMVRGAKENWRIYHWREKARIILSSALNASAEPREAAETLINQLVALGFFEFRDLLSPPKS